MRQLYASRLVDAEAVRVYQQKGNLVTAAGISWVLTT
jgi:hypothetical protein